MNSTDFLVTLIPMDDTRNPNPSAPEMNRRARGLRRNATDAERLLWRRLSRRQQAAAKFRRQHPVGPYILDFYCHELRLAIELDGGQHGTPEQEAYDEERTRCLQERGITVLRYWNHDVLKEPDAVVQSIWEWIVDHRGQNDLE